MLDIPTSIGFHFLLVFVQRSVQLHFIQKISYNFTLVSKMKLMWDFEHNMVQNTGVKQLPYMDVSECTDGILYILNQMSLLFTLIRSICSF